MSNEQNPYEVLAVDSKLPPGFATNANWYAVEDALLVCGTGVELPGICVFTGATEDLVQCTKVAQFASFRLVITQRACLIKYFVSRKEQKRRTRNLVLFVCAFFLFGVLMVAGIAAKSEAITVFGLVLTSIAGMVLMIVAVIQELNLRMAGYEAPGIFRIRGFPKPFLAKLTERNIMHLDQPRT